MAPFHSREWHCEWLVQDWDSPPLERASIAWEDETIKSVDTVSHPPSVAIVPGLINAHVHADFSQLIPALDLMGWLKRVVRFRRTQGKHPSLPREASMVTWGTVAWGSIVARPWEDGEPPPQGATRVSFYEVLGDDHAPLPPPGHPLSPHSPYAATPGLLTRVWKERRDSLKAIHLAESKEEVAFVRGQPNALEREIFPLAGRAPFHRPQARSPVDYLDRLGCLDERTLVIHGIFVDEEDAETLALRGARVVLCPRSNLYLAGTVAPLPILRERGIPTALGTDSLGSTPSLSLWEEMRTLWFHARAMGWNLEPREVLSMATKEGARCLGLDRLSGLRAGQEASFLVVRIPQNLSPEELATFVLFQGDLHLEAIYIKGQRVF